MTGSAGVALPGASFNPALAARIEKEKAASALHEKTIAEHEARYKQSIAEKEDEAEKRATENLEELEREKAKATEILKSGKPFNYMLEAFGLDHEGDLTAARAIALCFASSAVANGEGLHCYLSGSSGRGKSHSAETMFKQLSEEFNYNRSFSDKYLYYAGSTDKSSLKEGVVLLIDDQTMSPGIQEIFKVAVGKFAEGVQYGTVNAQKAITLKLPPRVAWVLLKVDDVGDDQVMNRLIQVRIQETDEKIQNSAKKIQSKYKNLKSKSVNRKRPEVMVCQRIWDMIKKSKVAVEVPCAGYVKFTDGGRNLRNHEIFFNLIMAHAVIHQWQRKTIGTTEDGIRIIEAIESDYIQALDIFDTLYATGGQAHNTIKSEDQVIRALLEMKPKDGIFTVRDVAAYAKMNDSTCYKALHGRKSPTGDVLGGLLTKCEYILKAGKRGTYETEVEHESDSKGYTVRSEITKRESHNEDIYQVNIEGLTSWSPKGKPVSLDPTFKWGAV